MSSTVPTADRDILVEATLPIHMEFFNRLVEAYPRASNGCLGYVRKARLNSGRKMEMSILRSFAVGVCSPVELVYTLTVFSAGIPYFPAKDVPHDAASHLSLSKQRRPCQCVAQHAYGRTG